MVELGFDEYEDIVQVNENHTGSPVGWLRKEAESVDLIFPVWNSEDEVLERAEEDLNTPEVYGVEYGEPLEYDIFAERVVGVEISGTELENYVESIAAYVEEFHKDPDISRASEQFVEESLDRKEKLQP